MPQDAWLEFHAQHTRTPLTHNRVRRMLKLKRREHRSQRGTRGTDPRATQAPRLRHYTARWRSIKSIVSHYKTRRLKLPTQDTRVKVCDQETLQNGLSGALQWCGSSWTI
jgi:hypothetical protein